VGHVAFMVDQRNADRDLVLSKFLLPTDAKENCFKSSIKIYIKPAPTCFGVIAIIRERSA